MAEPFGDQDDAGPGKRPAPTIEGTATEISMEPAPGESGETGSAEQPAAEHVSGVEPEDEPGAKKEPPRTSTTELKSFLTHLAAGLLGGLVGVVALAFAWKLIPEDNAGLSDVSALKTRLDKLERARPATDDSKGLAALDGRLKTLETRKVEAAPDLSGLAGRVSALEESLESLAKTAQDGGSIAEGAALDAKVNDMEQRLQASVAGALDAQKAETVTGLEAVQGEVTALKAKLGALAEANLVDASDLGPELTEIDQRLAKLEGALPALSAAIDRSAAGARSGALAMAFANLRDAVSAGRPFATELAAIQSLHPESHALGALPAHAGTGIPTVPELARKLRALARASLMPPPGVGESFVDSVIASAKSAIAIRRIDAAATGSEPGAVLARAEAQLKQGELAAAVKEVETLPAPSRDAFAGWLDDARARISADETLGKIESTVLLSLSGAAGAGGEAVNR